MYTELLSINSKQAGVQSPHLRTDLPNSGTVTGMTKIKARSRGSLMAQRVPLSSTDGREGRGKEKVYCQVSGLHLCLVQGLEAARLKRRTEEAVPFKGLLNLGKPSN